MKKLLWMTALLCGAFMNTVTAEPVNAVSSGKTYIYLSDGAIQALELNGVEYSALWPASFNAGKQRFKFRIAGGVVADDGLIGELIHLGGIRLAVPELALGLRNFIIETREGALIITAVVTINGDVGVLWPPAVPSGEDQLDQPAQMMQSRIAVFNVNPGETESKNDRKSTIVGSTLTPHPDLLLLLDSLGIILAPTDNVGTANLQVVLKPSKSRSDGDDGVEESSGDDHPGQGKEKSEEAKSKDKEDHDDDHDHDHDHDEDEDEDEETE